MKELANTTIALLFLIKCGLTARYQATGSIVGGIVHRATWQLSANGLSYRLHLVIVFYFTLNQDDGWIMSPTVNDLSDLSMTEKRRQQRSRNSCGWPS
jgi:hypothetical protein